MPITPVTKCCLNLSQNVQDVNTYILYKYFPVSHIILSFIPNQTLNHRTQFTTAQRDVKEAFR